MSIASRARNEKRANNAGRMKISELNTGFAFSRADKITGIIHKFWRPVNEHVFTSGYRIKRECAKTPSRRDLKRDFAKHRNHIMNLMKFRGNRPNYAVAATI